MKYPLSVEQIITYLETKSGKKMEPDLRQLFEYLVLLANDAYKCGYDGKPYSSDWVKERKTYSGSEPNFEMKLLLEDIDRFMNCSYEQGRDAAPVQLVSNQKGGVLA